VTSFCAQAKGPASDGSHGSNITAILERLAADSAKAKEAGEYGFSKYVAEQSLEELMAANLSGAPLCLEIDMISALHGTDDAVYPSLPSCCIAIRYSIDPCSLTHGSIPIRIVLLAGGEDTEEVLGWASGVKYDFKRPELFGK